MMMCVVKPILVASLASVAKRHCFDPRIAISELTKQEQAVMPRIARLANKSRRPH